MRVLLDECLPRRLVREFATHEVSTVPAMGWAGTPDMPLLRLAESQFDVFVTADQNVEYQVPLRGSRLAIVVLVAPNSRLETLLPLVAAALREIDQLVPGEVRRFGG